jgi:HK97 family phage major capsid protein
MGFRVPLSDPSLTAAEAERLELRNKIRAAMGLSPDEGNRPDLYPGEDSPEPSVGDGFIRSRAYRDWCDRFGSGGPVGPGNYVSDPAPIAGGMRALITSDSASAGSLVATQPFGLMDRGLYRPPTLLPLLTIVKTTSDAAEFAIEASHTQVAAPVAEATALTGSSGLKPEGAVTFSLTTATVRTMAVWVPATRRILSDATQLRSHIDSYLLAELQRVIEDQILSGTGAGEQFLGILNTTGVQTQAAPGGGESNLDVIRKARTLVELNGRTTPNAVVLHPNNAQGIDLLKINSEVNHFVTDPHANAAPPLWGLSQVITDAIPAGTAVVGDFTKAVLFDREQSSISVGTVGDDFVRNIVRVLGEARAAFGVVRPKAFCLVDLAA